MNTPAINGKESMSMPKILLLVVLIAVGFCAIYFIKSNSQAPENIVTGDVKLNEILEQRNERKPADTASVLKSEVNDVARGHSPKIQWNTPAGMEQVERWQESRGYFPEADLQIYKSYSRENITRLAQEGDVKALYSIAQTQIQEGAEEHEIISTYLDAAVYGSTNALSYAGSIARTKRDYYKFNGPDGDELFKKEMLESLALFHVGILRGDRLMLDHIELTKRQIKLTREDDQLIEMRAQQIYDQLESKRKLIGLGSFDNSVPELVSDYFDAEQNASIRH